MRAFLVALQFLTRLPLPAPGDVGEREIGRSLRHYPLVGLLIGLLLALSGSLLTAAPAGLQAALLLTLWVLITGALHLDGLADSADAWLGGYGDRARTLAIMKDPRSGPAAVVLVGLLLLLKFAALEALLAAGDRMPLILAPLLARTALPVLFLSTDYVRPGGLGAALAAGVSALEGLYLPLLVAAGVLAVAGGRGLWLLLAVAIAFFLLRAMMIRRLGGTTGDTAGALAEIVEAVVLVTAVLAG